MLATALAEGAPLWSGGRLENLTGLPLQAHRGLAVAARVRARTALPVHAAPGFDGFWWVVQGGPRSGLLIRQHDPAWSINP